MNPGSSPVSVAFIVPATAPSEAASPQPIPSISVTRMPSSRLVDGRTADARIRRPVRVNLKKQKTMNTQTMRRRSRRCTAARWRHSRP